MTKPLAIADAVKIGREWSGGSIRELARRSGVSAGQISRIEAGQVTKPSIETLIPLARAMDAHPLTLMVLAGHLSDEEARSALRPLVAEGSSIEEDYGWETVAAMRHMLDDPESTEADLRTVAFNLFSTSGAIETTWQESFQDLANAHPGVAGAELGEIAAAWPLIAPDRRRRILEFVRDQHALSSRQRQLEREERA
jgi:transcriptional regulator with XRE-family HTH domain